MELEKQKKELLLKTLKQIDEREMLAAKYRKQSFENQRKRLEIANRFRQPYYEKFLQSLKLDKKQIEELEIKERDSLIKLSKEQYKNLLVDLKGPGKACDERVKALLDYRKKNYKDNVSNPVHTYCGLKAEYIEQFRIDTSDYVLPQANISQPGLCQNLVRFQWDISGYESMFWAGFRAYFFWDNPPAGLIGGTAETHLNGAYYLESIHHCFSYSSAYLNGEAKLTLAQGGFPLYISNDYVFFSEGTNTPGLNEGSIGLPGPMPMQVPTINLNIPRNFRCEAGSPILGIVQVRFLGMTYGDSRVLLDCNSEDYLKINFAGLILTVES